jgi:hypothetical protein
MALRNNANTTATHDFEPPEDGSEHLADQPTPDEAPMPPATTTPAIAPKTVNTQVAVPLSDGTALKALQNAIPTVELESLGIGVFPRITVALDGFNIDKTKNLGTRIKFEVLSWSYVWLVTTGVQKPSDEDNKCIRTSYDGVNLKGGEGSVADYVKYLREADGYDKACVKQYVEVYANLLEFEEKQGKELVTVEVPADEQQIYQISLSPQSVGQWGRYMLESGLRRVKGIADSNIVVANQESKVIGANKFGIALFSPK